MEGIKIGVTEMLHLLTFQSINNYNKYIVIFLVQRAGGLKNFSAGGGHLKIFLETPTPTLNLFF